MKFLYGIENNYADITLIVYKKCFIDNNNFIYIPKNDNVRPTIFYDPLPNILKHIKVIFNNGESIIYDDQTEIKIPIYNLDPPIIKKNIAIKFLYGIEDNYIDITEKVYKKCIIHNNDFLYIPKNDNYRTMIFDDHLSNILKHIKVIFKNGESVIYDHHTEIKISIDYNLNQLITKKNNDIKFRIFSPKFQENSGGISVLHLLASKIKNLGFEVKMIIWDNHDPVPNRIFSEYTTENDIEDCYVIYPEIIGGNPLGAKKIIRWILCDLGKNCSPSIYKTWNKTDIVYFFSSYNKNLTSQNIKYLFCLEIEEKYLNIKNNERKNSCYEFRKSRKFHKNINYYHTKDDIQIYEKNIDIFSKSKYYYAYDPYTYNMILAALCGCIPVIYPLENVSKKEWTDTLFCKEYLKWKKKDFLYGIAYGMDDLEYASKTIHLAKEEQLDIINFANLTIKNFIEDIKNNNYTTINDIYY
jgi:hypothetical protein